MLVRLRENAAYVCVVGAVAEHLAMFGDKGLKVLNTGFLPTRPLPRHLFWRWKGVKHATFVVGWNDYVAPSSSNLPNMSPNHLFLITRPDLLGTDGNGAADASLAAAPVNWV